MACPSSITNTVLELAPPGPVADFVRLKFYKGQGNLIFTMDVPPNYTNPLPTLLGQGWIVKGRTHADNGKFSEDEASKEFDGCDPLDFPFSPTDPNIPGPDLQLGQDT